MSPWLPQSHEPVSLRQLFPAASFVGCADIRITDICEDSTRCKPRTMFAALPGTRCQGTAFVTDAVSRGASSILVERPLPNVSVPQCVVRNVRAAYSYLCEALHEFPSQRLKTVGVTGTNGKTTTTFLIRSILQSAGHPTGLLGTIEYDDGIVRQPAQLTTPDSATIAQCLSRMVCNRQTHVAMELSSHALDQGRAAGTELDVAVITNITHDHFDYHHDSAAYIEAKARIFDQCKPGATIVLNANDPATAKLKSRLVGRKVVTYGLTDAQVTAEILETSLQGTRFRVRVGSESQLFWTSLIGAHNVSNCLAAIVTTSTFGLGLKEISAGIERLDAVPGRLERVTAARNIHLFVDYAHTPDALTHAIQTLKPHTPGRLICVFGAGGDRDRMKRPLLGRAATAADIAIVTSDNPRSEDPSAIIRDVLAGMMPDSCESHIEADRKAAIELAISLATEGDSVLIAGKGHETIQEIAGARHQFDDRQVVRDILPLPIQHRTQRFDRISA